MPPRITRKSIRPRVSDRSMVDTVQPHGLPRCRTEWRRRDQLKMHPAEMDDTKRGQSTLSASYKVRGGWMSRKSPRLPVEGEVFFLTSPFIDQALSLITPGPRPARTAF